MGGGCRRREVILCERCCVDAGVGKGGGIFLFLLCDWDYENLPAPELWVVDSG